MGDTEKSSAHVKVDHVEGEVPLERNFSFWACFGLGFALLNSWTGGLELGGGVGPAKLTSSSNVSERAGDSPRRVY